MTTPQQMQQVCNKFDVYLGEKIQVGLSDSNVFCSNHEPWKSPTSFIIGQVVGTTSSDLVVAFSESSLTDHKHGAHNSISAAELAPEHQHLLKGSPNIFRIIFNKAAFKKIPNGQQGLLGRIGSDTLSYNVHDRQPSYPSVEVTIIGATSTNNTIHVNKEYDYLKIMGHNGGSKQNILPEFIQRIEEYPRKCWFIDLVENSFLTMPKKFDDIFIGDRVQIPYTERCLSSYGNEDWIGRPEGYVNATIVGIGEFGPIAYIDDEDIGKVVGPHEQVEPYRIADRFVHNGSVKLTNRQFWQLNEPKAFIKVHEATEVKMTQPTSNEKVGLRLGDHIVISRVWQNQKIPAQIVGFTKSGNPVARMVHPNYGVMSSTYIDNVHPDFAENASDPKFKYWFLSAKYADEWEKNENSIFDTYNSDAFKINETVNGKVNNNSDGKGEVIMDNNSDRKFFDMVKSDATEAAYRVASKQITKGTKTAVLSLLAKQGGSSDGLKAFAEMMDTEIGEAILSSGLGMGMTYLPLEAAQGHHVQKLAEEFRINGMSTAGNAVFETAMEYIMPVITSALAALPAVENQARVASGSDVSNEEYIEETHLSSKQARV